MSVNSRINLIKGHIEDAYEAIEQKSGTIPANKNIANLANAITSIQGGGGAEIQLNPPILSFGTSTTTDDPLIITNAYNGNFVSSYDIYDGQTFLVNISANLASNTINLRNYISSGATHTIRVIAKGTNVIPSNAATITYIYTVYITVTKTLSHCSLSDNDTGSLSIGDSYEGVLTAENGYSYVNASVSILMNGEDVTSQAYNGKYGIRIREITGDITINITFAVKAALPTPQIAISDLDNDLLLINKIDGAEKMILCLSGVPIISFDYERILDLSQWLTLNITYSVSIIVQGDGYLDSAESNSENYLNANGHAPDPILANNDWLSIRLICEAGQASSYWYVGNTKRDLGVDGTTRTFRICDMQGLYGKHVVFEQVELESPSCQWNTLSNADENNCLNNYSISNVRNNFLPTVMAKYSQELQTVLTPTTYKVAKNGMSSTILELTDKLFLPAEKELFGSGASRSTTEEQAALTKYQYYPNDSGASAYREKEGTSWPLTMWWTRSPSKDNGSMAIRITTSGNEENENVNSSQLVAPCFSF